MGVADNAYNNVKVKRTLPYEFTLLDGGQFYAKNRYGSITRDHFCAIGIVADQDQQPHGESDNKERNDSETSTAGNEDKSITTNEEGISDNKKKDGDLHSSKDATITNTTSSKKYLH